MKLGGFIARVDEINRLVRRPCGARQRHSACQRHIPGARAPPATPHGSQSLFSGVVFYAVYSLSARYLLSLFRSRTRAAQPIGHRALKEGERRLRPCAFRQGADLEGGRMQVFSDRLADPYVLGKEVFGLERMDRPVLRPADPGCRIVTGILFRISAPGIVG